MMRCRIHGAPCRIVYTLYAPLERFQRGLGMIDMKLIEILACPACKGDVEYDAKNEKILCTECMRKYPVRDGIPVMLIDEAEIETK